ncbi:MAG: lysylphosphatidylglycerol synthase transmembrane domain-containing protein [Candidatus Geothermincolia bacterium]
MDQQSRRRYGKYVVIAIGVSVAAVVIISLTTMDHHTLNVLKRIDVLSFVVVLGLVVGKWASECLRFNLIVRGIGRRLPFRDTSKAVLGSAFTGSVTPYRSATVPVQIFFLSRYGLTGGEATAVTATGAALSVLLLTISMPIVLILGASKIHFSFGIRFLLVMGAFIGFFVFMFAVYSMRDPSRVSRLMKRLTPQSLQARARFERVVDKLEKATADFSSSLRRLLKANKLLLAAIVGLTLLYWFSEVFVASWILRGLGHPELFWKALLAQVVVSSVLPFTPVPGESGIAEAAFAGVFSVFVARNMVAAVTLVWRFFMFYIPLIGLGIFFVLATRDATSPAREREALERAQPDAPALAEEI